MSGKDRSGDVSNRVGVEQIEARGVNVKKLTEKLIDAPGEQSSEPTITIKGTSILGLKKSMDMSWIFTRVNSEQKACLPVSELIHASLLIPLILTPCERGQE